MRNLGCHLKGREIAKAEVEGLRMVQYGVVEDETVYITDPGYSVEKVSIADRARVRKPVTSGERLGLAKWCSRLKVPKLRRRNRSNQADPA
jgi:hypothetical protein